MDIGTKRFLCNISVFDLVVIYLRSTGETLSKDQFEIRRNVIREVLFPSRKPHILASQGAKLLDPFLSELALRERSNRVGLLSANTTFIELFIFNYSKIIIILQTIIFLRHYTKSGFEISGYIDFEQSLRKARSREEDSLNWDEIFSEKKRLWPQPTDLGLLNKMDFCIAYFINKITFLIIVTITGNQGIQYVTILITIK